MISEQEQPNIVIGIGITIGEGMELFIDNKDESLWLHKINTDPNTATRICSNFLSRYKDIVESLRRLSNHAKD
jgi:hypothetical protein